jgi:SnoaL-like domain
VRVGGDIAYAFGVRHMTGTKTDTELDLWFRCTAWLVRRAGTWKIVHMHNSMPFAMDGSRRALLHLKPLTALAGSCRLLSRSCNPDGRLPGRRLSWLAE